VQEEQRVQLATLLEQAPVVLTEGALIERLRRDAEAELDPHVLHAGFVYEEARRAELTGLYREYLAAGRARRLPMVVCTPTWRANPERLRAAGLDERSVNRDGVRFVREIQSAEGQYAAQVAVGGLMGCRGDAYDPGESLSADDAATFHADQARELADAGVDFVLVATLPALPEARGMARALAATAVPYVLSFVLRPAGTLLDGTPLGEAIGRIDSESEAVPLAYWANCVHPAVFAEAMERVVAETPGVADRVLGLQANTSRRCPEELDGARTLDAEPPAVFAEEMMNVRRRFGLRVLGGCCGTDAGHIDAIAERIVGADNAE
jgi:homocysteine S-methyltransferase